MLTAAERRLQKTINDLLKEARHYEPSMCDSDWEQGYGAALRMVIRKLHDTWRGGHHK